MMLRVIPFFFLGYYIVPSLTSKGLLVVPRSDCNVPKSYGPFEDMVEVDAAIRKGFEGV